jgi:ribosomal protein L24
MTPLPLPLFSNHQMAGKENGTVAAIARIIHQHQKFIIEDVDQAVSTSLLEEQEIKKINQTNNPTVLSNLKRNRKKERREERRKD